ncbi:hypothetical protein ACNSOO_04520 [Aliarcobacter lanthieri]|uniref:hypothetical protein n=1 Tax=Aliarcobacter lanthieri TaxID=1355374 RepID=UPI003AAAC614
MKTEIKKVDLKMNKTKVLIIKQPNAPRTMALEDKIHNASLIIERLKNGFRVVKNKLDGKYGFVSKKQIELYKNDSSYEVEEYEDNNN